MKFKESLESGPHKRLLDMAGEWEGTFESRGSGLINPVRQPVELSVSTTEGGRVLPNRNAPVG